MFQINLELPSYLIIICILLGVMYAYFLYNSSYENISKKTVFILFSLRTILISIIAAFLLNPIINSNIREIEKPILIFAKDVSKSVKENINNDLQYIINKLADFEIFTYSFSDKVHKGFNHENNGLRTDFSRVFYEINSKFENRNVAGIIMSSDGCYNSGYNPEYISYDFPVYCIALGDTSLYKDVSIDNVANNEITFLGNSFPLEISLKSILVNNETTKLNIWNNGLKIYDKSINFINDVNYNTYKINLPAEDIGLQSYLIKIDPLKDEMNHINNVYTTYIDVIDSRYNILILKEKNSPDLAAYKSVIDKNANYNIEVMNISDKILIDNYQLVVCFGIDNIPKNILDHNIPMIIFNADQSHYSNFNSSVNFTNQGSLERTTVYKNIDFSKFLFSKNLMNLIVSAPPLFSSFGQYSFQGDIEFVLNKKIGDVESNNPIMMIQEIDSRKIAYLTAQGWWRWKLYDYSINNSNNAFDELFSKLTQYIVIQEDKSLFRLKYQKKYNQNDSVFLRAELYNKSYELVNNREVNLVLVDKNNKEYTFQFLQDGNSLLANIGILEVGSYDFIATVKGTNLLKKGSFEVKEIQVEKLDITANHDILRKIANLSNGNVFYSNNIDNLIETIKDSAQNKKVIHFKENFDSLLNIPWILLILFTIISLEWFIRKYNGLV